MKDQIATGFIIGSAILLVAFVLLQQKGGGLGGTFGSESGGYRTKRGAEKILFWGTIVLAIIFVGSIFIKLLLK